MDLSAFTRLLLRRGWLMPALGVLGVGAAFLLARVQTPVYEAVTRVAVNPARPADLGQTQAIRNIMRSYGEDIRTTDVGADALERLRGGKGAAWVAAQGLTAEAIRQMLHTSVDLNVYEIQIAARAADAEVAEQVSSRVAEAFRTAREKANLRLDKDDQIKVSIRDRTATSLYWPKRRVLLPLGAVLGVLLGAGWMLLMEYLESAVVRTPHEAERGAGVGVLAEIPWRAMAASRSGALRSGLSDVTGSFGRLMRQGWPVLALALLGAVGAFAFSKTRETIWIAHTRIALEAALGSDWGRTQAIPEVMRGFSEQLKTSAVADEVNNRLELDRPTGELLDPKKLNVASKDDIYEIVVDFRDPDRRTAEAISRTWGQVFVEQRVTENQDLDQPDRILARLRGATESEVWSPKPAVNGLAGGVLGALIGLAAVVLFGRLRARFILTPAEAGRAAGVPILGDIPTNRRPDRRGRAGRPSVKPRSLPRGVAP